MEFWRELCMAFTPELNVDEIVAMMVSITRRTIFADRIGLFIVDPPGPPSPISSLVLKVSRDAKGIRLPVRGLAGHIVVHNVVVNVPDAYQVRAHACVAYTLTCPAQDERFDSAMDNQTGYCTRQVLGVPLTDPHSGEVIGALQVLPTLTINSSCVVQVLDESLPPQAQVINRMDAPSLPFTDEHRLMLELAASQLAEALHRNRYAANTSSIMYKYSGM
jgi:GAF domain-containing protein